MAHRRSVTMGFIQLLCLGMLLTGPLSCGDDDSRGIGSGSGDDGTDGTDPGGGGGGGGGPGTGPGDGLEEFVGDNVTPDNDVIGIQEALNQGGVSMEGQMVMPSATSAIEVEGVTDWRYGARAGYSMIHDDICDYQMGATEEGWKLARDRDLPVGWGIVVSRCQRLGYGDPTGSTPTTPYWSLVQEMVAGGQEIINHSYTHPNIQGLSQCSICTSVADCEERCPSVMKDLQGNLLSTDISVLNAAAATQVQYELVTSGEHTLRDSGLTLDFYAFPLDLADDNIFTILRGAGYSGSRGGEREISGTLNSWNVDTSDPLADFRILFDAYNEEAVWASHHAQNGLDHMLSTYLNAAVRDGKWALRELHSIRPDCNAAGHGWGPVTRSLYVDHLDNVVERISARQVWMAKNVELIGYRRSRAHCGTPQLSGTTLSFSNASDPDCAKYATPVTVSLQGPADTVITAVSAGEFTNLPGGRVLVTMTPTASVNVTLGTGTTPAATHNPATFVAGLDASACGQPTDCQPLGACNCENPVTTLNAYDPSAAVTGGGGACGSYGAPSIDDCDLSAPSGWQNITMSGGYCAFPNQAWPAADGGQWGAQMSFYNNGLVLSPKTCMNAASQQGIRVCVQGEIKNAFPKTRYVAQGLYDITDTTRSPTEVQNVAWVYMITDYTAKTGDWNAGHCTSPQCSHPFFQISVRPDQETCVDIRWSDFEFPYWWGDANVGFVLPEVCAPGGQVPSAEVCREGEDYDPETVEALAKWHVCPAMAEKLIYIIVAAVDDIGSAPVETNNLRASVSFF